MTRRRNFLDAVRPWTPGPAPGRHVRLGARGRRGSPAGARSHEALPPTPPPQAPSTEEPSPEDKARTALENGLFWTSRGDDNRALGWFQECLGYDNASARCHLELARLHARQGAVKDAVRYFTHHLALVREGPTATEARNSLNLYASTPTP